MTECIKFFIIKLIRSYYPRLINKIDNNHLAFTKMHMKWVLQKCNPSRAYIPWPDWQQICEKGGAYNLEICGHNQGSYTEQPLFAGKEHQRLHEYQLNNSLIYLEHKPKAL